MNENMEGETYWPPHNVEAGSLVRKEINADEIWPKYRVYIKRYHDEYIKARNNIQGITKHDDFNYETEKELGGMSKKISKILSSSDTEEEKLKKNRPKLLHLLQMCHHLFIVIFMILSLRVHTPKKERTLQKKKLNIKINSHKRNSKLLFALVLKKKHCAKCIGCKEKDSKAIQKELSSQSLSSNKVINATNSLKKQSQEHQTLMQMQTERSKYNQRTLSENNNKLQQSRKFPQPLSNVKNKSDYEDSENVINITEDSGANAIKKRIHEDIPFKAASNFEQSQFHSNIDENQTSSSTTSERHKMQDLKLQQLFNMNRKLGKINYKLDTVIINQGKLNRSLLPHEKKRLKSHNMPSLPLTNESDVQAMEKWLKSDNENNIALCDYLSSFGSTSDEKKLLPQSCKKLCIIPWQKNLILMAMVRK